MPSDEQIRARIAKALREARGSLSQPEAADLAEVSERTWNKAENLQWGPPRDKREIKTAEKIVRTFELDPADLGMNSAEFFQKVDMKMARLTADLQDLQKLHRLPDEPKKRRPPSN